MKLDIQALPGIFISLEGGEGAGKTTMMDNLVSSLKKEGFDVVKTREPGGCLLAEKVRSLILSSDGECKICTEAELLLFLAARSQHVTEVILPALQAGKVVLCDRFHDSTVAYQGFARNLGVEKVEELCLWSSLGLQPHLTFYLDLDPHLALQRTKRRTITDRIEQEPTSFHNRVREGFLHIAKKHPLRSITIDASQTAEQVYLEAWQHLQHYLAFT